MSTKTIIIVLVTLSVILMPLSVLYALISALLGDDKPVQVLRGKPDDEEKEGHG